MGRDGDASSPEVAGARCPFVEQWLAWIDSHVAVEDVRMGRPGAVCPCVPGVLRTSSMRLVRVGANVTNVIDLVKATGEDFLATLAAGSVRPSIYCVALVFAPGPPPGGLSLSQIHHELKPWFIERGMMLGEFFPGNRKRSVRSADLTPMDCPVHALVIRASSEHDLQFIAKDDSYSPAERASMKQNLREHLARQ